MLKISAVCGSGLGSSFMMEMNIQNILQEMGIGSDQVEVSHSDLGTASASDADVWICGRDLESSASHLGDVRVLSNIIDQDEMKSVVTEILEDKEII